jgi:hypothetical protein
MMRSEGAGAFRFKMENLPDAAALFSSWIREKVSETSEDHH